MSWKKMPYWLIGGIIGVIIVVVLMIISFIGNSSFPCDGGGMPKPGGRCDSQLFKVITIFLYFFTIPFQFIIETTPYYPPTQLLFYIEVIVIFFIIGAIIGLIIGKIKSRGKNYGKKR